MFDAWMKFGIKSVLSFCSIPNLQGCGGWWWWFTRLLFKKCHVVQCASCIVFYNSLHFKCDLVMVSACCSSCCPQFSSFRTGKSICVEHIICTHPIIRTDTKTSVRPVQSRLGTVLSL